jgi:septation ring formation regulator EzrA
MNSLTQEIQAHYDEVQRQLQVTLDQYGIAQRKLQSVTAELEEIRGNYEAVCSKLHLVTLLTTLSRIL